MFTASPARWLAPAFIAMLIALCLGNLVLLAGAVFLLVLVLIGAALCTPQRIVLRRKLPRSVCWAGDSLDVQRQLDVQGGMGTVYVYDPLPGETQLVSGNNLRVIWHWPGTKTYDLPYRILCPKRGVFALGETQWETEATLGLNRREQGTIGPPLEISVVPRNQAIRRVNEIRGRAHSRRSGEDVAVAGISTTDFMELRPYNPGDPMRSVNWKASARNSGSFNPLLVNQYEPEGRKAVWLFLDGSDYMEVGPALHPLIDEAAEAAGAVAQYYLTRGYTLGAYVYNSNSDILTPELGHKQFQRLTNILTRLEPGASRQNLAEAIEMCKSFLFRLRPEVYVITRLDVHYSRWATRSPDQDGFFQGIRRLASMRRAHRRSNQVRVVHLESGGFQGIDTRLEEQALGLMRWEVEPLVNRLHRSGVSVMRWDPTSEDFAAVLMRDFYAPRAYS